MTTKTLARTGAQTDLMDVVIAALAGLTLIYFVGFSQMQLLHDTAHDARHALAFPCH